MHIRRLLSIVGWVAIMMGAVALVAAASPLITPSNPHANGLTTSAVYVGSDACFTCHIEEQHRWSNGIQPRQIGDDHAPHALPMARSHAETTLPIRADREPVITTETQDENTTRIDRQQYVLQTDTGAMILPGHWRVGDQVTYEADPNRLPADDCANCHRDGDVLSRSAWSAWAKHAADHLLWRFSWRSP